MNDGATAPLVWTVLALGSGTLLIYATTSRFRHNWWLATIALALLAIAAIGSASAGRALAVGIVAALAAIVLLLQWYRVESKQDPLRKRRLLFSAVIAGGIACGAFIGGTSEPITPNEEPVLVLDPTSERAELLAEVNAAHLELELILERDLPERERSAREARDWPRLELLARVRARALQERDTLAEYARQLANPAVAPPSREAVQTLLEGLERLLGAVRRQR